MSRLRLVLLIAVAMAAGMMGSLIVGHETAARAADADLLATDRMTQGVPGARAVVMDITAPGRVSPKMHVVYDFEKKTVSLIMIIQQSDNSDRIYVRQVTSYLTPTKDK